MSHLTPFINVSTVANTLNKIQKTYETSPRVFERTIKDMVSRAPGKIASAVTSVYGIKKSEIRCKRGEIKTSAGTIYSSGKEIASLQYLYKGRVLTPLHFSMTPKNRPDKKKYKIKAKIKKQSKIFTAPDGGGVFLAQASKSLTTIPWLRNSSDRLDISPIKTISLPQMVDNKDVREVIDQELGDLYYKRFNNHMHQHLMKNLK